MATQSIADLSVDIKVQGLAGVKGDLDKLQSSFKRASSEAERIQRSLGSQLSSAAAVAQKNMRGMTQAFQAANDNFARSTPIVQRLRGIVQSTTSSLQGKAAALRGVTIAANQAFRAVGQSFAGAAARARTEVVALSGRLSTLAAGYLTVRSAAMLFHATVGRTRELANLSAQTGIAIDRLTALESVARRFGLTLNDVVGTTAEFGQRVSEALTNPSSEAGQALALLNIEVQNADGSIRSFEEVLPELADRFSAWADGAEKARLATALLGEQGRRWIPVFNQGGQAIREAAAKARELQTTIDPVRLRAFDRALEDLRSTFLNFIAIGINPFIDALTKGMDVLSRFFHRVNENWERSLQRAFLGQAEKWRQKIEELKKQVAETEAAVQKAQERFSRLSEQQKNDPEVIKQYQNRLSELANEMQRLNLETEKAARILMRFSTALALRLQGPVEIDDSLIRKAVEGIQGKKPAAPKLSTDDELNRLQKKAQEIQQFWQAQAQFAQEIALQRTGLIENMILTEEQHARAVEQAQARIREAYGDTLQAQMMITEMQRELQRQHQEAILDTAQMAARTLTQLFPKSKAAAVAEGIMNTAVGVTRALRDVPWPLNWIQAGLVAAAGAAQIASIRSANLSGSGSLPRTPTTGGSTSTSQPAAPPSGALIIQMPRGSFWSNDAVAELIERINTEVKNGRTLISTQTVPF